MASITATNFAKLSPGTGLVLKGSSGVQSSPVLGEISWFIGHYTLLQYHLHIYFEFSLIILLASVSASTVQIETRSKMLPE